MSPAAKSEEKRMFSQAIGVEVEQETSAPPPKKILDPPLIGEFTFSRAALVLRVNNSLY